MKPHTFTVKANGLLDRIISFVQINQSKMLCDVRGLNKFDVGASALWDTGASGSCISKSLASKLGLTAIELCNIAGVGGIQESDVYLVDIQLPNQILVSNIRVSEFLDNGKFDVILGMDIITLGDFSINNFNKESVFRFSYPPAAPIEFGEATAP
jgi:predicted aspartyl protease